VRQFHNGPLEKTAYWHRWRNQFATVHHHGMQHTTRFGIDNRRFTVRDCNDNCALSATPVAHAPRPLLPKAAAAHGGGPAGGTDTCPAAAAFAVRTIRAGQSRQPDVRSLTSKLLAGELTTRLGRARAAKIGQISVTYTTTLGAPHPLLILDCPAHAKPTALLRLLRVPYVGPRAVIFAPDRTACPQFPGRTKRLKE
jgi:hypothetical protein